MDGIEKTRSAADGYTVGLRLGQIFWGKAFYNSIKHSVARVSSRKPRCMRAKRLIFTRSWDRSQKPEFFKQKRDMRMG
jgi:hypothetical protein